MSEERCDYCGCIIPKIGKVAIIEGDMGAYKCKCGVEYVVQIIEEID